MGVLKEMRQKQLVAVPGPQWGRRRLSCLVDLGRSAGPLHPLESSSDTTFSKNLSGPFPELEGPLGLALCLTWHWCTQVCRVLQGSELLEGQQVPSGSHARPGGSSRPAAWDVDGRNLP